MIPRQERTKLFQPASQMHPQTIYADIAQRGWFPVRNNKESCKGIYTRNYKSSAPTNYSC